MSAVIVRREAPGDRAGVAEVNTRAFESNAEAKLVDALRSVEPVVSLVAVQSGRIVGHILFTPVQVQNAPDGALTMGLGPIAVVPELQHQGIGGRLIRAGLDECRALGAQAVFVLGHSEYYPRFGFRPAPPLGLRYKGVEFDPHFMVIELKPGALAAMSGQVEYAPAFDAV